MCLRSIPVLQVFYSFIQYISEISVTVLHYTTNDLCFIDMYRYLMMAQLSRNR
jgi:hypothetical protein